MSVSLIQSYLENTRLQKLLEELKAPNIEVLIEEIGHFTEKEAEKRDQIVLGYFGEGGVNRIVDSIVGCLLSPPRLRKGAEVLDVGAGSGLFTLRVVDKLRPHLPRASFYAMDVTPGMLQALSSKTSEIVPFLGVGENIAGSVEHARKYFRVPKKFDAVFSTLMLHHCPEVEKVFGSVRDALKAGGKAVFIDLCKHPFKEFMEMGDVHLGFQPDWIETMAKKHFSEVHVERMPGICCECSGRSAELFLALVMP